MSDIDLAQKLAGMADESLTASAQHLNLGNDTAAIVASTSAAAMASLAVFEEIRSFRKMTELPKVVQNIQEPSNVDPAAIADGIQRGPGW